MESVSERYAGALFALALEQKQVDEYQKEAREVYRSLHENGDMIHLLSSAFMTQEDKDKAVDEVYASIKMKDLKTFIKVVVSNHRVYQLERSLRKFIGLCDENLGIAEGTVYSTYELSAKEIKEIEEALSKQTGMKTMLANEIDASLIGGIKVVLGEKVYDGSLSNSLANLKASLIQGGSK
jgi:F-type H+-transporting ATPase subunit delta